MRRLQEELYDSDLQNEKRKSPKHKAIVLNKYKEDFSRQIHAPEHKRDISRGSVRSELDAVFADSNSSDGMFLRTFFFF